MRMPYEDRFQSGILGVLTALRTYDPSYGARFNTHATYWIRQSIMRDFRYGYLSSVEVPQNFSVLRWFHEVRRLTHELEREPTAGEVATSIKASYDNKTMANTRHETLVASARAAFRCISESNHGEDGDFHLSDLAQSLDVGQREYDERQMLSTLLAEAKLTERASSIIKRRFGIGQVRDETLEGIAQTLGITKERVRQIEAKSLGKLMAARDRIAARERQKLQRTMFGDMNGGRCRLLA